MTVDDVIHELELRDLDEYAPTFRRRGVTGTIFFSLQKDDLVAMGITDPVDLRKIMAVIDEILREEV